MPQTKTFNDMNYKIPGTKGRFIIYRMGRGGTFADYGLMALEIAFEASLVYP